MSDLPRTLLRLYDGSPVLVAAYDTADRLRYANRAFRAAFFLDETETPLWSDLMRRNFRAGRGTVIRAPNFDEWLLSTQSRRGKTGFRAFETDLVDGRWLWMTETVQLDGWMLCIASDITALRPDERLVRQDRDFALKAAQTDDLTGLANRRFVTARMEEMLRQPPEAGIAGCVCVLDLDHFKSVNDRYGHQVGDMVLRDFAVRIHAHVRRADCFGRVGGEEFLLVLPNTRPEEAVRIVERMMAGVRLSCPLGKGTELRYTFSAGIAAGMAGQTAADVYAGADKALYAAKLAGRDRVVCDTPPAERSAATG